MQTQDNPSLDAVCPDVKIALRDRDAAVFGDVIATDVIPQSLSTVVSPASSGIIHIDGVISSTECRELCTLMDGCQSLTFWNAEGRENETARLFRDADTVEVVENSLASKLWDRIKDIYDTSPINVTEEDPSLFERELPGLWYPVGLNQNFLFAKYPPGGHFAPHTDGREIHSFNRRSFHSVIIFLNTIPQESGGGTRFYTDGALTQLQREAGSGRWTCGDEVKQSLVLEEVPAVEGRMVMFDQRLVHEGICCAPHPHPPCCKYIIRSDIMYERRPAICDSPTDKEAYDMFRQAEALAEAGNVEESIPLFRTACKKSPALAEIMGQ